MTVSRREGESIALVDLPRSYLGKRSCSRRNVRNSKPHFRPPAHTPLRVVYTSPHISTGGMQDNFYCQGFSLIIGGGVFVRSFVRDAPLYRVLGETWRSKFFTNESVYYFIVNFFNQHFFQAAAKRGFQLVFSLTRTRNIPVSLCTWPKTLQQNSPLKKHNCSSHRPFEKSNFFLFTKSAWPSISCHLTDFMR
jgi:hypothetical protein